MKIFFNEKYFLLTKSKYASGNEKGTMLVSDEGGLPFSELIADIEKNDAVKKIVITTNNIVKTFDQLASNYRIIEAAGGLVKNNNNEYLLIYRNNKWDLPKGKIENDETIEQGALREVKEECGLKNIKIISSLGETYHIYFIKNERILKRTYWFAMASNDKQLTPQLEEGITDIKWANRAETRKAFENSYGSIKELIDNTLQ